MRGDLYRRGRRKAVNLAGAIDAVNRVAYPNGVNEYPEDRRPNLQGSLVLAQCPRAAN